MQATRHDAGANGHLAEGEVSAMLIEPVGVVNTGEAGGELTATYDDDLMG